MTKEQIEKLGKLQGQKERVQQIANTISKGKTFRIVAHDGQGYNVCDFQSPEILGLTEELQELLGFMTKDRLEELEADLEALTLCKKEDAEVTYKPTEI
jgi:hypothetical protein